MSDGSFVSPSCEIGLSLRGVWLFCDSLWRLSLTLPTSDRSFNPLLMSSSRTETTWRGLRGFLLVWSFSELLVFFGLNSDYYWTYWAFNLSVAIFYLLSSSISLIDALVALRSCDCAYKYFLRISSSWMSLNCCDIWR